jgi:hypothetical protein
MLASDIRVLLAICYIVLVTWRSLAEGHTPDYWWIILIAYIVSVRLTAVGDFLVQWWRVRRVVQLYRLLDPTDREAALHRMWMAGASHRLRELVEAEGVAEVQGAVERYPFARGAKIAALAAFWIAIGVGGTLYCCLIILPRLLPPIAWGVWALGSVCIVLAGFLRRRMRRLESTLEVNQYGITEVEANGTRHTIRWKGPLLLRYRRWPQRFELSSPGQPETIALDFERVAVDRAFRLTLEYGGFDLPRASKGDAA